MRTLISSDNDIVCSVCAPSGDRFLIWQQPVRPANKPKPIHIHPRNCETPKERGAIGGGAGKEWLFAQIRWNRLFGVRMAHESWRTPPTALDPTPRITFLAYPVQMVERESFTPTRPVIPPAACGDNAVAKVLPGRASP